MSGYAEQLRTAIGSIRELKAQLADARRSQRAAIAIVGIGCRFPGGADSLERFAERLEAGLDAVVEVPSERWDLGAWYDPDPDTPGKMNTRWGAFLDGVDQFDPGFFEISEREAAEMDPQQRLMLEVAWHGLEHAAIAPASLRNSRSGVFVGINGGEYYQDGVADAGAIDAHTISGGVASVAAGRISYILGLTGPAIAVDTACSSSLAAVHLACRSLRSGECDLALAGGVYVVLEPNLSVGLSKLRMMAADGRCKPFDARGDGFVQGEGAGIVVLKRLDDAEKAGDRILAVIRGSAMNQDGRSSSLTAPSRNAQVQLIRNALEDAGVAPQDVSFIEAHGTGTALGDPIEANALGDVFGGHRRAPLIVGAIKSNIGHLGPAAGIAGLIKAALSLHRGRVPGNLHFETLNPAISVPSDVLTFPTSPIALPPGEGPVVAGVSAFGFSGTNVHVVLQSAAARIAEPADQPPSILVVSARSASGYSRAVDEMRVRLGEDPVFLSVCQTAALGRNAFEYRRAIVARSSAEARDLLAAPGGQVSPARPRLAIAWSENAAMPLRWLIEAGLQVHAVIHCRGQHIPPEIRTGRLLIAADDPELSSRLVQSGVTVVLTTSPEATSLPATISGVAVDSLALDPRLDLLAKLFQHGFNPDWKLVLPAAPRADIPLTEFERHRCWRTKRRVPQDVAALPGELIDGPLPGHQFRLRCGLGHYPFLSDHRVAGRALVPGAFQIACMMLAAGRSGRPPRALAHLTFPNSLVLPETGEIEIWTMVTEQGDLSLLTRSDDGSWVTHAAGECSLAPSAALASVDVERARSRCASRLDGATWRHELAGLGISVGPSFSGVNMLWKGDHEALAEVSPVDGLMLLDGFLHPAFLDACLQTAGGALPAEAMGRTLLPIGLDELVVRKLPDGPVMVHARMVQGGSTASIDLDVADSSGQVLVEVRGLSVAPAARLVAPSARLAGLFHEVLWQDQPVVPDLPDQSIIRLEPSDAGSDAILRNIGPDRLVALCGSADDEETMIAAALQLARRVASLDVPPRVVFGVHGSHPPPLAAALAGLAATLRLEQPATAARYAAADDPTLLDEEIRIRTNEGWVERRDGVRRVPRLARAAAPSGSPPPLSGSVLVTGGFGGLGRALAPWLLQRGAEALVLAGRNADEMFCAQLMAEWGRPVVPCRVDLAEPCQRPGLLSALGSLPPLRAIYHAAGAQVPAPLADLTDEAFHRSFDAKAHAALYLHEATLDIKLDEFVLFSSIASLLGAAGQGGYAPANAVLDSLARHRCAAGLPASSVRLGRIAGEGMTRGLSQSALARIDSLGISALPMTDVLEALGAALSAGLTDPVIARVDWRSYGDRLAADGVPPLLDELCFRSKHAMAAQGSIREQVLDEVRRIAGIGRDREVDRAHSLVRLGFDSLMAIELRNSLRKRFGKTPSLVHILGDGTVGDLLDIFGDDEAASDEWEELVL